MAPRGQNNSVTYSRESKPASYDERVPPVKACHMAMTPICLIFWSPIDKVEKLLCAHFQPLIAFC